MGPLPPNATAPPAHPNGNLLPHASAPPAALRRLPGGEERTGRSPGAAAFGRPGAALWAAPGPPNKRAGPGPLAPGPRSFRALRAQPPPPPALGFAPLPRWSRGNGVPGGEGVRNGACASCAGGRCPRFYGSSPGDRRSADRTYRKGTGGPPAFQRGKGRY